MVDRRGEGTRDVLNRQDDFGSPLCRYVALPDFFSYRRLLRHEMRSSDYNKKWFKYLPSKSITKERLSTVCVCHAPLGRCTKQMPW